MKYGEIPPAPYLDVTIPSFADPALAPEGHHVMSVLAYGVPYALDGGWKDARREELGDRVVKRLAAAMPDIESRIVARQVLTPLDLEEEYGTAGGHLFHGEHGLDQLLFMRPDVSCARYATPLGGLYLCGSSSHPGGGITCAPGALGASTLLGS